MSRNVTKDLISHPHNLCIQTPTIKKAFNAVKTHSETPYHPNINKSNVQIPEIEVIEIERMCTNL